MERDSDMGMKKWRRSFHRGLDMILAALVVFLFAFMVVVGTYQILVRYLLNSPSTVSEELLTYAFAWMSLLASVYVFGKRGHMRMGFLADRLQGETRRMLDLGIESLVLVFAAVVMVYGGSRITRLTMTQKTASLGIPMGCVYGIVPVCGGLMILYAVMNLMELWSGEKPVQEKEPEKESEVSEERGAAV